MRINVTRSWLTTKTGAGFYTDVLGFVKKTEIPLAQARC